MPKKKSGAVAASSPAIESIKHKANLTRPADRGPAALRSLRRSAKAAVALARRTGTPAYVIEVGRIVDIAKPRRRNRSRVSTN